MGWPGWGVGVGVGVEGVGEVGVGEEVGAAEGTAAMLCRGLPLLSVGTQEVRQT